MRYNTFYANYTDSLDEYKMKKDRSTALTIRVVCAVSTWLIIILFVLVYKPYNVLSLDHGPIAITNCGNVQGRDKVTEDGRIISEFLFIPFAVPPVGERRWRHSELLSGDECWEGIYEADTDKNIMCVQAGHLPPEGQEDCLYLSVRTPNLTGNLPVLVWIHGGGFETGYSDWPGYSADANFTGDVNVVTVNINYRLHLLGFLSRPELWQDGESYGNFGIYDMIVALQWVHDNIINFGGDESRVTIMGHSAGGTAVLGLLASPKAKGLFQKAIALSPSPHWNATYKDANSRRPDFLTQMGCENYTSFNETRSCLKKADIDLLLTYIIDQNRGKAVFPMAKGILGESLDYNVIEPYVIPYFPEEIPNISIFSDTVRVIISNTASENGFWTIVAGQNKLNDWAAAEDLLKQRLANFHGNRSEDELFVEIKQQYSFGNDSDEWWPQIAWDTITTDIRATCPTNDLTNLINISPHHKVYRLYTENRPSETVGHHWDSFHGWDTEAMFNFQNYMDKLYNKTAEHDQIFKTTIRNIVTDFGHDRIEDWDTTKTIYVRNDKPWTQHVAVQPQTDLCKFWYNNGFQNWGWQN